MGFFDFLKGKEQAKAPVAKSWKNLHRFQMSQYELSSLLTFVEESENSCDDDEKEIYKYIRQMCKQRNLPLPSDFVWSLGGGNDYDWLNIEVQN